MIFKEKGRDTHQNRNVCGLCGKSFRQELEFVLSANIFACQSCFLKLMNQNDTE